MQNKILIISDNMPDQINGVVTTFKNVSKIGEKNGYDIRVLDPSYFRHFSMPKYPEVKISIPFGVANMIEETEPDYIHIATEGPLGLAARIHCDKKRYKYNTSYHTKFPEFLKKIYRIPEFITYMYVRWFHKHSGKVLTTTKSMVNELKQHNFTSEVIPWTRGVDRKVLKPRVERFRNIKPVVLYVGRVSKEKGLDDLCKYQHLYCIDIVGDGPYKEELAAKYPNVRFLGYKTGKDLADCYAQADVFCFPSKADTFGIVIIEAMSIGTPVAAYPVSGPIDIVEEGLTGFLSNDLREAIDKCLTLNNEKVKQASAVWSWEECWNIFEKNLVKKI